MRSEEWPARGALAFTWLNETCQGSIQNFLKKNRILGRSQETVHVSIHLGFSLIIVIAFCREPSGFYRVLAGTPP